MPLGDTMGQILGRVWKGEIFLTEVYNAQNFELGIQKNTSFFW